MPSRPQFLVGTASWTDPTLVKSDVFYPPALKTAEERLRFYAAQFNTVEVDASYYVLISERNAELWAERAPPGFIFNIKAFAMLTQHPVDTARLPAALKSMLSADERAAPRLRHPTAQALEMAFGMFWSALAPLRAAGKLGHLLFQFPPYFTFVSIDTPPGTVESIFEVTGFEVYVRFHGRNRENWYKGDGGAAERFKYLYAAAELAPWAERLKALSGVRRASVIFNNCYSNSGVMNAATMQMLKR